jgi:hypothetical protein
MESSALPPGYGQFLDTHDIEDHEHSIVLGVSHVQIFRQSCDFALAIEFLKDISNNPTSTPKMLFTCRGY